MRLVKSSYCGCGHDGSSVTVSTNESNGNRWHRFLKAVRLERLNKAVKNNFELESRIEIRSWSHCCFYMRLIQRFSIYRNRCHYLSTDHKNPQLPLYIFEGLLNAVTFFFVCLYVYLIFISLSTLKLYEIYIYSTFSATNNNKKQDVSVFNLFTEFDRRQKKIWIPTHRHCSTSFGSEKMSNRTVASHKS